MKMKLEMKVKVEIKMKKEGEIENKEDENLEIISPRRSTRISQPSTRLQELVTYEVKYPIENFISYKNIIKKYRIFLTSIASDQPSNFKDTKGQLVWCKAMKEELDDLEKMRRGK
jgi:hypothetical protein